MSQISPEPNRGAPSFSRPSREGGDPDLPKHIFHSQKDHGTVCPKYHPSPTGVPRPSRVLRERAGTLISPSTSSIPRRTTGQYVPNITLSPNRGAPSFSRPLREGGDFDLPKHIFPSLEGTQTSCPKYHPSPTGVPRPSRVLCERAGTLISQAHLPFPEGPRTVCPKYHPSPTGVPVLLASFARGRGL
jgi:hypothetical protein